MTGCLFHGDEVAIFYYYESDNSNNNNRSRLAWGACNKGIYHLWTYNVREWCRAYKVVDSHIRDY